MNTTPAAGSHRVGLRSQWGWFVALGVGFLLLGLLAMGNLIVATLASVFFVGIMMTIGGVGQIIHAFRVKSWGGFFFWLLSGILYAVAGFIAFYNPLLAAAALTFALAVMLLASGVARIVVGFQARPGAGWGWIVASGVITGLAGILVALGWPINTLWLLGLILAIDLIFQGVFAIALGLAVKSSY